MLVFAIAWVVAIATYPGWSAFDSGSTGYDPRHNFLCDLLSRRTPDGRDNSVASSALALGVVALLSFGLLRTWWRAPVSGRRRTLLRVSATACAVLSLALFAQLLFGLPVPHGATTLAAAATGFVPTACVARADWRREGRLVRWLLVGLLGAAVTNFVGYACAQLGAPMIELVPIAQQVTLLCLLGWLAVRRSGSADLRV